MNLPGFCGPTYVSRSVNAAVERAINLFPEKIESQSSPEAPAWLLASLPGLKRWAWLPGPGVLRGLYPTSRGRVFAVIGERVYEVFAGGGFLQRGTLTIPPAAQPSSQFGHVSMADNGLELVVVDGQAMGGWSLRLSDNLWRPITGEGFVGSNRVDFFDGFFVFDNITQPQQVYISGLYDVNTEDPLDFASAEVSPDPIMGHIVWRREWWIGGPRSMEIWFNAGAQDFPFAPIQGTHLTIGLAACHSLKGLGASVYWLSQTEAGAAMVMRSDGYQAVRISTHAQEIAFGTYRRIDDAIAYTEELDGHEFYVITFPTGNATWAYDARLGLWHERADLDPYSGNLVRYPAQYHAYAFGQHLVGGDKDSRVYVSDPTYYSHDGEPMVRERSAWHVKDAGTLRYLYWSVLEIDMECGVGLDGPITYASNPQAMLRWSDDGGASWNHWRQASLGPIGKRRQRVIWRRLGKSRDRVIAVRITDPVRVILLGARFEAA